VVADGTAIPNVDLSGVLNKHHLSGACVTVVVHTEARRNGGAAFPVPSGIYIFERRAFDGVPSRGFCDIKERLIPQLYDAGERIVAYEATSAAPRVLDAATYLAVNGWMVEQVVSRGDLDGYLRLGNSLVHRDAFIAHDASIVGPVLVGPGVRILSDAVVVGPTSIGCEATIESGVLVSRSAVWRRSVIGARATADQCIVADDAAIESGKQAIRDVVIPNRQPALEPEWTARESALPKSLSLDVATRLGRLVFGAGWSRSAATQ
jgi:NDP-sugar pyrophosphorylase family protein